MQVQFTIDKIFYYFINLKQEEVVFKSIKNIKFNNKKFFFKTNRCLPNMIYIFFVLFLILYSKSK